MVVTIYSRNLKGEYVEMATEWSDAWAVVSDPAKFAAKFNSVVPGAFRPLTADDARYLMHCGLIGRRGFFERADLETVRGILLYEQVRERAGRGIGRDLKELVVPGKADKPPEPPPDDTAEACLESCGASGR